MLFFLFLPLNLRRAFLLAGPFDEGLLPLVGHFLQMVAGLLDVLFEFVQLFFVLVDLSILFCDG